MHQYPLCVFKALAHPTRQSIIEKLAITPLTVTELHRMLNINQSTASKHLGVLEDAGIVTVHEEKNAAARGAFKLHCYTLHPEVIRAAVTELLPVQDKPQGRKPKTTA